MPSLSFRLRTSSASARLRRARAEEAAPEAGPLFVGPVHEAQGDGTLLRGEGAHDFEGAD